MSRGALAPGATIGILGGGQLGRMLSVAASRLGLRCHIYSDTTGPAFDVAAENTVGSFDDEAALKVFAKAVDVATTEFENVPAKALARIAEFTPVYPPPRAVEISQDRLVEKEFLRGLGIGLAPFAPVNGPGDLIDALKVVGTPALLKTRRFGYDGKGQLKIADGDDPDEAWRAIGAVRALLEGFVAFEREISVIAVRSASGTVAFYDPTENRHENGILAESRVPATASPLAVKAARATARSIIEALDYVGVLCVEMFLCAEGSEERLLVNEIAPRVHNSGHWTIDACLVSQFENHIRAIAGWPLGPTDRHSDAVMTNLIGADVKDWEALAARPDLALHVYGKHKARPGRKMGHATRLLPKSG